MGTTKISYADRVANLVTGCSAGCSAYCWARDLVRRFPSLNHHQPFNEPQVHVEPIEEIHRARKPYIWLVSALGELFDEAVPFVVPAMLWGAAEQNPEQTILVLTKQVERMASFACQLPPVANMWLGISVTDQATADERIPVLLEMPAAHRVISVEPMLGPMNLEDWLGPDPTFDHESGLSGVMAGAESGPARRPAPHAWFDDLRQQCAKTNIPFYLKQRSENPDGTGRVIKLPPKAGELAWRRG